MQQGGSQYGVSSEMTPFAATTTTTSTRTHVLGGADQQQQQLKLGDPTLAVAEEASPISSRPPAHSSAGNFDEFLPVGGGLPDEDALAAGDEGDRGGVASGNRWPRQETLALLKIRSEMDVAFRDATLKGPLWEDVSRKLAELGYSRSAKKCKEKFENVHKYYKRTKEGRAGRQDGKSYRFFSQLEALHSTATSNVNPMPVSSVRIPSASPSTMGASPMFPPDLSSGMITAPSGSAAATAPAAAPTHTALGISFSSNTSNSRRMMDFFESLMKQVMEKQEVMQQRFLETIEKREQDRMIREEAWKRQEMARLPTGTLVMAIPEQQVPPQDISSGGGSLESSSSRWPKTEVLALINLRSGLDSRYQEAGPKGPLWEEISAGMQQMGYKRSAKRCKEKWENINKYFKKVKESNKKRPEDAKTCPYFHQLDALYRKKLLGSTSGSGGSGGSTYVNPNRPEEQQQQQPPPQHESAKLDPIPTPYSQDRAALLGEELRSQKTL
ncbi:unnamed protein product, partial [Vitis vinifera]